MVMAYSSFDENVLGGGTSGSDSINACLVQIHNQLVGRFIMELIVAVEDDVTVRLELRCNIRPECLKSPAEVKTVPS
jgi:hypothetical protein